MNKGIGLVLALTLVLMASAQNRQRFTGVITDSMCATGDHSQMKMGPTDAECTKACVNEHDASYVLYDGKDAYVLDDQKTPEKFAGKRVVVTGTVDRVKMTMHVTGMALASGNK